MKKIIYVVGIIVLSLVVILNVVFTANLDRGEHITINFNNPIYVIGLIVLGMLIFLCTNKLNKYLYTKEKKKTRKWLFIAVFSAYILFCTIWTIFVRPPIVADQVHVSNLAQTMRRGDLQEFLPNDTYAGIPLSEYVSAYQQQITLAFVYNLFFRIIFFDAIEVLRALNVIAIILIPIALWKISEQISKKHKINKALLVTLTLTFFSIPMLSTFIYGDTPSLACCLFSVYFMMKYTETKQIKFAIIATIFSMFAYMMRMNSLIFIIATVIYLLLNLFKEIKKKKWKEKIVSIAIIMTYIIVSIVPSIAVKNYYIKKYDLDKDRAYPNISFFLIAMEESWRGNGWYNESIGEPALKNPQEVKEEYKERVKERLKYFSKHLDYTFDFYTKKIASMWTENTYSAITNNISKEDDSLENLTDPLEFYQKALLILMCVCSLIVLLQNRKDLSLEVIFLVTIFIGGFAFHILWEAKSRYIIPYIVALIPAASISINKISEKR